MNNNKTKKTKKFGRKNEIPDDDAARPNMAGIRLISWTGVCDLRPGGHHALFLMSSGRSGAARAPPGGFQGSKLVAASLRFLWKRSADEIYDPVPQCPLFWLTSSEYFLFYLHFWHRRPPETTTHNTTTFSSLFMGLFLHLGPKWTFYLNKNQKIIRIVKTKIRDFPMMSLKFYHWNNIHPSHDGRKWLEIVKLWAGNSITSGAGFSRFRSGNGRVYWFDGGNNFRRWFWTFFLLETKKLTENFHWINLLVRRSTLLVTRSVSCTSGLCSPVSLTRRPLRLNWKIFRVHFISGCLLSTKGLTQEIESVVCAPLFSFQRLCPPWRVHLS